VFYGFVPTRMYRSFLAEQEFLCLLFYDTVIFIIFFSGAINVHFDQFSCVVTAINCPDADISVQVNFKKNKLVESRLYQNLSR